MLTDRGRRISGCNGSFEFSNRKFRGDNGYGFVDRSEGGCRERSPSRSSASKILRTTSPTSSPPSSTTSSVSLNHQVSKFDTLAGIAIKYGVEVADITKLNGLVTDLQMFALKSLRIPLPGRHPPSPCVSNGSLNHGVAVEGGDRSSSGGSSAIAGKGLALRSKAASRANLSADSDTGNFNSVPINLMDALVGDRFSSVRKSFSALVCKNQTVTATVHRYGQPRTGPCSLICSHK